MSASSKPNAWCDVTLFAGPTRRLEEIKDSGWSAVLGHTIRFIGPDITLSVHLSVEQLQRLASIIVDALDAANQRYRDTCAPRSPEEHYYDHPAIEAS